MGLTNMKVTWKLPPAILTLAIGYGLLLAKELTVLTNVIVFAVLLVAVVGAFVWRWRDAENESDWRALIRSMHLSLERDGTLHTGDAKITEVGRDAIDILRKHGAPEYEGLADDFRL